MKKLQTRHIVFWALCCSLGMFSKRLIAPAANIFTDFLHIPGGIGTSFSLMFLLVAARLVPHRWSCTIMSAVQSGLALGFGMVGSMGGLSPIGYIVPGIAMDLALWGAEGLALSDDHGILAANIIGALCASLTANLIVFHLRGLVLLLYLCVSATSGAFFGMLGGLLVKKLRPALKYQSIRQKSAET